VRALRVAGSLVGLALTLVGLGGLGDDLAGWGRWLSWLDAFGGARFVFPMVGVALVAVAVWPALAARFVGGVGITDASIGDRSDRNESAMWRLSVQNRGRPDRFRVKVEDLRGTGGSESSYHLPWRLHREEYAPLLRKESDVVNVAQWSRDPDTAIRALLTDLHPFDLFSVTAGTFRRSATIGTIEVDVAVYGENDESARGRETFAIDLDERGQPRMRPIRRS
jgi:hypothetical protein